MVDKCAYIGACYDEVYDKLTSTRRRIRSRGSEIEDSLPGKAMLHLSIQRLFCYISICLFFVIYLST